MWTCPQCSCQIRPRVSCSECSAPTDFPTNITRAAEAEDTLRAKIPQVTAADSGDAQQCLDAINELFRLYLGVAINIQPGSLVSLLQDPRIRYINLVDNLRAGANTEPNEEVAAKRRAVDLFFFGPDGERLNFGAVSLGGPGLTSYGSACMVLDGDDLRPRVSFLERNSFSYVTETDTGPRLDTSAALRALWDTVYLLVYAKHQDDIGDGELTRERLSEIVLKSTGNKKTDEFVEAQIFPPITRQHIKRIVFAPKRYNQDFRFGPGTATVYIGAGPNATSFRAEPCTSAPPVGARARPSAHRR